MLPRDTAAVAHAAPRPDLLFELTWRPFLLNADMPRAGMSRPDYVVRKFGGEDRARRLYASITEIGRAEGVPFRFERIRRTPSSVDAHRLVRFAGRCGRAGAAVEALFSAHFTDGLDIGEAAVLAAVGNSIGLEGPAVRRYLAGDEDTDGVHADNLRAIGWASTGCRVSWCPAGNAIAGAQEPEVIERLLDVAAVEAGG